MLINLLYNGNLCKLDQETRNLIKFSEYFWGEIGTPSIYKQNRRSAELRLRQRRLATLDVQGLPPLRRSIPQRGPSTPGRLGEKWSVVTKSSQNMLNESIYFCSLFIVPGQAGHFYFWKRCFQPKWKTKSDTRNIPNWARFALTYRHPGHF
ncbi:Hypothetical_protein [Hexamita inflata]|uniref:Hypothetical_protein n=1 Tax=Hexamita inflata TaxID=28002 RepID=A0AA86TY51_9EUKA|nr:Hypothetical protein HINF_LOCUS20431 [Hexamita inflata]